MCLPLFLLLHQTGGYDSQFLMNIMLFDYDKRDRSAY